MLSSQNNKEKAMRFRMSMKDLLFLVCCYLTVQPLFAQQENLISKPKLIEDVRQLVSDLVANHPDPYYEGGGKLAFYRRVHQILSGIPAEGLTRQAFYELLRPLIVSVGDGHTAIAQPKGSRSGFHSGIPLNFRIAGYQFYVAAVYFPEHKYLLGSRLTEVEGVSFDDLVEKQRKQENCENEYFNLLNLRGNLRNYEGLKSLVPGVDIADRIAVKLLSPENMPYSVPFDTVDAIPENRIAPPSRVLLPSIEMSDPAYGFLDKDRNIAVLKIQSMTSYRECIEKPVRRGDENTLKTVRELYQKYQKKSPPQDPGDLLAGIPSATGIFRSLVVDMKKAGTEALLIDLRDNLGGYSPITTILFYFLYGLQKMEAVDDTYSIGKYSPGYLQNNLGLTLDELNKGRPYPVSLSDYDFDAEDKVKTGKKEMSPKRDYDKVYSWLGSPFLKELEEGGRYEAYFLPSRVVVLMNPWTFSAAFEMAAKLKKAGAILLGTPSAQAGNLMGAASSFGMKNSGLVCYIPCKKIFFFPNDADKGKILKPDYELTYEKLREYNFDPNAEILWALDLFPISKTL